MDYKYIKQTRKKSLKINDCPLKFFFMIINDCPVKDEKVTSRPKFIYTLSQKMRMLLVALN